MMNPSHPYSALTPDCALDALDATGLKADGRLLALNSYENRVYQMGVEDAAAPVVVKFYRPERWRDAAILEANHARLRPILMTSVMLVLGMLPMALGTGPAGSQGRCAARETGRRMAAAARVAAKAAARLMLPR